MILTQEKYLPTDVDYILLKTESIPEECTTPIIYNGNISLEGLDKILSKPIYGIHLKGGTEIRPGYKDFDELADILESLEID